MDSLKLITDPSEALNILNDPFVINRQTQDGQDIEFTPELCKQLADIGYLLGHYVNDVLTGVFWGAPFSFSVLQVHINYRKRDAKHAFRIKDKALEWCMRNISSNYDTIMALIPACNGGVIKYVESMGFESAGAINKVFNKGGEKHSLIAMTIPREVI